MIANTSGNYSSTNYGTVDALSVLRCIPLIFIGIASFMGNALVLLAIYRFKNLQTFSNAYIGSLATTDLLASLVMAFSYTSLLDGTWVFGDALCQIQGIILIMLSTVPMLTLLCFSIYRCYLVTTVSKRLSEIRLGRIVKCSVCSIWLLAVVYSIPLLFGGGDVKFIPEYYSCIYDFSSSKKYSTFLVVFLFAIPLAVMSIAYMRIIRFIKMHNKTIINTKPRNDRPQSQFDLGDRRSSEELEEEEGDHFTVMELKRRLEEMDENEDSVDWEESRLYITKEDGEKKFEENMEREETIEKEQNDVIKVKREKTIEEGRNEEMEMKRVSLRPTSDYIPDKRRSYSLQRKTLEEPHGSEQWDEPQRRFSLNFTPRRVMQKFKSRIERQKLFRQYRKRVSYQARLARILITTLVLFIICWAPLAIDSFFLGIGYTHERPKFFPLTSLWLAYTNAVCNPIVYALLNKNFKVAFKRILKGVFNIICVCHH